MLDLKAQINWIALSWDILLGYVISWLYFFFTVRIFTSLFGNINGTLLNYGISWVLMIAAVYILQKLKSANMKQQ
jgi:hypothetical protein